nr:unnamed protein product [Digitaria exilis]
MEPQPSSRGIHPRAVISVTLEAPQPSSRGIHPRAVISVTLEAPQPSSRGIHPRAVISVTLEAPQPSSRGIHPRAAFPSRSRLGRLELAIQARSAWSKRLAQARKLCPTSQTPTFNLTRFEVQFNFFWNLSHANQLTLAPLTARSRVASAAPARAALAAGNRLPSDMAGCPRSRCTPLTSADSPLAVASPPRTAGFCPRLLRPRVLLFPRPVSSRLAHARLPPAARLRARVDAAHGANTAATSPCRRGSSPSCLSLHPELPEHPSTPLSRLLKPSTVPLPSTPEKHSPELAEAPPSSLLCTALPAAPPAKPRLAIASPTSTATPRPTPDPLPPPEPPASPPPPAHVHSSLRSISGRTEGTISFLVPCWCSPTTSPSFSDPNVAAATAVVDLVPGHPRPQDLAQTNHGEPLSISPHFPGPVSPPFGRRNHAGELEDLVVSSTSFQGAERKMQGLLVPAAEEIAQESEVNVVHVDPSPEQEYRFEPEGKPRSIT